MPPYDQSYSGSSWTDLMKNLNTQTNASLLPGYGEAYNPANIKPVGGFNANAIAGPVADPTIAQQQMDLANKMAPWQTGLGAAQAGIGLANTLLGYKQYGLDKERFGFQKKAAEADYAAKAKAYNEELGRASDVGLALAGATATPEMRAAEAARVQKYTVKENL